MAKRMVVELDCYMNGANPGERVWVNAEEGERMIANGLAHKPGRIMVPPPTKEEHETDAPNPPASQG